MKNRNRAYGAKFTVSPGQVLFLTFNHWAQQIETNQNAVLTFNKETGKKLLKQKTLKQSPGKEVPQYQQIKCAKALVDAATSWYLLWFANRYPWAKGTCTSRLNKAVFIQFLFAILFLKAEGTTEHLPLCSPPLHEPYDQWMNTFFCKGLLPCHPKKVTLTNSSPFLLPEHKRSLSVVHFPKTGY